MIIINLTAEDVRLGSQFGTAGRRAIGKAAEAGFYLHCGDHVARCTYRPTYGFEGFGADRRRVTYPTGAIRVPFGKWYRDCEGLDDAKDWLAGMVQTENEDARPAIARRGIGPFYPEAGGSIVKVHGHSGLVAINEGSRLYVIKSGDNGYSCWGFDVAEKKGRAVADWLGRPDLMAPHSEIGTPAHYDAYAATLAAGAEHHRITGNRCDADLIPALIGYEGVRVEVTMPDGEVTRFRVGKSTGWLPCHLEMTGRAIGGPAAFIPEGSTVRQIG